MGAFRFDADSPEISAGAASPRRQLYGYLSLPKDGGQPRHAVLLCNPFGQKSVRTHRLYRVLSERFSRIGLASLRFDYFGSGDSDGEDAELTATACIENILRADAELRQRTGCSQVSWFGLRFGATMAALASTSARTQPDRLILWDPVENGTEWLQQLRAEHRAALEVLFSNIGPSHRTPGILPVAGVVSGEFESQGFVVSRELNQALQTLSIKSYLSLRCGRLVVLAAGDDQYARLQTLDTAQNILSFDLHKVAAAQWNTDEAMNTAMVPNDVVNIIVREMTGGGR